MLNDNWLQLLIAQVQALHEPSLREQAADLVDALPVPSAAADWADLRREMLIAMALAALCNNPAVTITARKRIVWSKSAPTRLNAAPDQPTAPLADRPRSAADEMRDNLGQPEWHERIDAIAWRVADDRRRQLRRLGEALFGPEWVSPTSRELGVSLRTVQRWAAGERGEAPSDGALADMRRVAARLGPSRRAELQAWLAILGDVSAPNHQRLP